MSISNIIDPATGVIYAEVLPNPYPHAQGLGATLAVNNSAFIPNTTTKQDATDFDLLGCVKIETGTVGMGNQPALVIGEPGDILQIKGATTKGSLLVGNGLNTEELALPTSPPLPNGSVLIIDSTTALGVRWGGEGGDLKTITPGNNIDITGTSANAIVAFQSPTTSDIVLGSATKIVAKDNYATPNFTTEIDATGFNDKYDAGGVVNQEDIAVSSTNVVQTLSTTDGSNYSNSAVLTCNQSGITDQKTATENVSNYTGGVGLSCFPTATSVGCGITYPTSPPFPNADGNISIGVSSGGGSLNPSLSLSASAPFQPSYSTILDKNGLVQNNSTGTGFNLQTLQDLTLTCPSANKIIVPNGNDIDLSSTTGSVVHTTTYGKDGMESQDFLAGNYASQAQLTQIGGNSQMTLSSSNLATPASHILQTEVPLVGDAIIGHTSIGTIKNLQVQSQGYIELKNTASNNNIFCGSGGLGVQINATSGNLGVNATAGSVAVSATTGVSISAGTTAGNTNSTTILNSGVAGQANPTLTLTNTNAVGSVATEIYKNKPTAGSLGDVLALQSVYGKDSVNNKQEYTRITHTIRDPTNGSEDGSIDFACIRAGSINTFLQLNGVENEVNCLKNLDMTGNNIITNTGDMTISTATSASGTGRLTLQSKEKLILSAEATHELELNANSYSFTTASALSPSAGGSSGNHLAITINGVPYKIALLNP